MLHPCNCFKLEVETLIFEQEYQQGHTIATATKKKYRKLTYSLSHCANKIRYKKFHFFNMSRICVSLSLI